ncbi:uncharacterized protein K452DRAFT_283760 [Aplosporella prunicola CBS 121167]|uniref:Uncharacterized protein n=1 Tax=Aplosporella prunicola CBS 121167 TaxID=1176127 RepID=A0A6A6BMP7_9PEZI|nr:uncharacterized protein K452DRAFT_283760 [Aplosporella prunicola CBS 121167]KAF2145402.1 hypothetical protein K452DRAFT_283760 [Aplosporella prunicola CBS 121167]
MSAETQARRCPQLPFELWTRIISCLTRDTHYTARTWFNFRQVSHMLKAATEEAFLTTHLKKTCIHYNLGMELDKDKMKCYMSLDLAFIKLSDDRSRAIFGDEHPESVPNQKRRGIYKVMQRHWENGMDMYLGTSSGERRFDLPPHTILLRRFANDTDLPGLEIDYAKRAISFEWKGMFNALFSEELYVQRLLKKNLRFEKARASNFGDLIKSGEMELEDAFMAISDRSVATQAKARKRARRERARRWYKKHEGYDLPKGWFEMDYDEREKLKDLTHARTALDWEDIDDEEMFERIQSDDEISEGGSEDELEDDSDYDDNDHDLSSDDGEYERMFQDFIRGEGD